jgi:1-deoxy-D-xylulose-5-phosphate reductoisomerase
MVEFADGSVKAQMSYPDMRLPIQYALSYPERFANPTLPRLDWDNLRGLTFEPPDFDRFPCLRLGIEAGKRGGTYPAALAAADEVAVEMFLEGRIGFADIARIVAGVLDKHESIEHPGLEEIIEADKLAREQARQLAGGGG